MKNVFVLMISSLLLMTSLGLAQNRGGGHSQRRAKVKVVTTRSPQRLNNRVVVRRSIYRPEKVVVYRPFWAPRRAYNRRWVYFPRHNFYWDNWRQVYVYRNATVWIYNAAPPATVENVNIENEKHYELKADEDDIDDVYQSNDAHKTDYKPE